MPANKIAKLLAVPGVVAIQKDALNQPLDDNTSFLGATNVWPTLGGSSQRRLERRHRRDRHGRLARAPDAVADRASPRRRAGGLKGCQFGDGSDAAHLGPTFACNNKLIGAYAKTATYMVDRRLGRPGVLQQHDGRVLAA